MQLTRGVWQMSLAMIISGSIGAFVLLGVIWVVNIVFSIIAAIKANKGEWYTYPATIRFVS